MKVKKIKNFDIEFRRKSWRYNFGLYGRGSKLFSITVCFIAEFYTYDFIVCP